MGGTAHAMTYLYDLTGSRTRTTWWDGVYVDYDRLVTGEFSKVRLNGATTGADVLATYSYDDLGRTTSLVRGNNANTTWGCVPVQQPGFDGESLSNAPNSSEPLQLRAKPLA